jgi:uncharacterized membrane protein YccC
MQVAPENTLNKTRQRLIGTVLGACIAALLAQVATTSAQMNVLALVTLTLMALVVSGPRYWLYVTFLTPTVILLTSTPSDVLTLDVLRVLYTAIGAGLATLASVLVLRLERNLSAVRQPEADRHVEPASGGSA